MLPKDDETKKEQGVGEPVPRAPFIDESFARGLMHTFQRETEAQWAKAQALLKRMHLRRELDAETPKGQRRLYRSLKQIMQSISFGHHLIEGKRGCFAFGFYGCDDEDVDGRAETLLTTRFWSRPLGPLGRVSVANRPWGVRFGLHCVARVFQRVRTMHAEEARRQLDAGARFAGAYWTLAGERDFNPSVFVPAPDGAFLGFFSPDRLYVDLRTFVGCHQFSRRQELLWKDLRSIGDDAVLPFGWQLTPEAGKRVKESLKKCAWPDYEAAANNERA
jgi:hypothetical protein